MTAGTTLHAPASTGTRAGQPRWSLTGLALAVVFFCASLTPTLLPLSWFYQGIASGLSAVTGYGIGAGVSWLVRKARRADLGPGARALASRLLLLAGAPLVVAFLVAGSSWQRAGYRLIGADEPNRLRYLGVLPVALVLARLLLGVARLIRAGVEAVDRWTSRWVPIRLLSLIVTAAIPLLIVGFIQGPVNAGLSVILNAAFRASEGGTNPGTVEPSGALRSGGPGSLVSWESLGREGRDFVAEATTTDELRRFAAGTVGGGTVGASTVGASTVGASTVGASTVVRTPIRVYVGLRSTPDPHARAALAVRELERTGAFNRKVLTVVTTTGSGWVDPRAVDALEFAYGGDTATVSMQYSYLPSWMAFLGDRQSAEVAGRELFEQVYRRWAQLPADRRPRLLAFGESLGAFGTEAAFPTIDDVRARADGVLLEGPLNSSPRWQGLIEERDPGSTEVLPVIDRGRVVRFAGHASDLAGPPSPARPLARWEQPRVVYLQHGSDPVVWWTPDLLAQRPDWLAEPSAPDVPESMRWFPVVTFWQVTAALAFSTHVPPGYGHNYGTESVDAWMAIAPPQGWTPAQTQRLRHAVTDSVRLRAGPAWLT